MQVTSAVSCFNSCTETLGIPPVVQGNPTSAHRLFFRWPSMEMKCQKLSTQNVCNSKYMHPWISGGLRKHLISLRKDIVYHKRKLLDFLTNEWRHLAINSATRKKRVKTIITKKSKIVLTVITFKTLRGINFRTPSCIKPKNSLFHNFQCFSRVCICEINSLQLIFNWSQ